MKGMIFAAGLGTRLKPWTDLHPKALALVNGKSLLQRNIEYLQQYGVRQIIINVHHYADQIIEAVLMNDGWGSEVIISNETSEVLETGGGLKKAAWFFEGEQEFVLMNADVLTDMNLLLMLRQHEQTSALATLATSLRESSRYFLFNNEQLLCGWQNVKTGESRIKREDKPLQQAAFSGVHIINTRLLSLIEQTGKFSMVDVYLTLAAKYNIRAFNHTGSKFIDVGKPENVFRAEELF